MKLNHTSLDQTEKDFKKLISKASKYANQHSYMDMKKGICELMARFHLKMLEECDKDIEVQNEVDEYHKKFLKNG